MSRAGAISTHAVAAEVASDVLTQGGSALRATLAGFFAAAGGAPGVLFGPLTLLMGGVGVGARVFDGRCRQPGLEGKRPRGFQPSVELPGSARAAIPGSIWALAVATAYHQGASLMACVRPGATLARKQGAEDRARLLEIVGSHGPRTFLQPAVRQGWLTQFGPVEGGLVQPKDLEPSPSLDRSALEAGEALVAPWAEDTGDASALGTEHGLLSIDAAGMLVALTFRDLPPGIQLDGFGVTVPELAQPVLRGVPRVAPGTALPTGSRAKLLRSDGKVLAVSVLCGDQLLQLARDPETREVTASAPGFSL